MTDTTVTPHPQTPAEVAAAVLEAIEASPDAFYMDDWANLPDDTPLQPYVAPSCGTTLCAAGWAAHLTGWTLVEVEEGTSPADIIVRLPDGRDVPGYAGVYAEKAGERREVAYAANVAFGFQPGEGFWHVDEATALAELRRLAGR